MDAYLVRSFAENQARVDILPPRGPRGEHILTDRAIPDVVQGSGYMKVLDEYETSELFHDVEIEMHEVVYARYDSQTNTVQCTIKIKDGTLPPYLTQRPHRPMEPSNATGNETKRDGHT